MSQRRLASSRRTVALLAAATIVLVLPNVAGAATQGSPPDPIKAVNLADAPYELPPPPPPLSEQQYEQPVDLSGLPGIWPDEATTAVPGGNGTATEILDSATPLLADGSPNTDVFGLGANDADHIATAYTGVVNNETPSGNWRDIQVAVDPVKGGWTYTDGFGSTTAFPAGLDSEHAVVLTTAAGTLSIAPVGSPATGSAEGDTVTYPDVFATADLLYRAMLNGVQDRIVLDKPPSSPTFAFSLSASGLSVAPNAYGGWTSRPPMPPSSGPSRHRSPTIPPPITLPRPGHMRSRRRATRRGTWSFSSTPTT